MLERLRDTSYLTAEIGANELTATLEKAEAWIANQRLDKLDGFHLFIT